MTKSLGARLIAYLFLVDRARFFGAIAVFIGLFAQFFGTQLRTGFRILSGDSGDGGLIAFLHEHVYKSILGNASFRNPTIFYPIEGTLGYTDTFLLNQIFYAPLRLLGVEQFIAVQMTYMALALTGATAFAMILVRFFGVRAWLAIMTSAVFAFGHGLYVKTGHPQHLAIHFIPVAVNLALASMLTARSMAATAAFAFSAGLLLGLTFVTGFYMAWFASFFLLLALPVFVILSWSPLAEFARAHRQQLIVSSLSGGFGFAIGAALLLWVYLPTISSLGPTAQHFFMVNAATYRDIINVSDTHLLWGALLRYIDVIPLNRLQFGEVSLAVTPLLVIATLFVVLLALSRRQSSRYDRIIAAVGFAMFFGYVAMYLCTITFKETSLFFLVRKVIPGASAIRVGFRSQVVSAMFITFALAICAEAYLRRGGAAMPRWRSFSDAMPSIAIYSIIVVVAFEQVDLRRQALLDRAFEIAAVANVPQPPITCRVFANYNDGSRLLQAIHIDAMRMSQRFGIPTVNGYSGGAPPGWDIGNVWEPSYPDKVRRWTRDHGVQGTICLYNATNKTWSVID